MRSRALNSHLDSDARSRSRVICGRSLLAVLAAAVVAAPLAAAPPAVGTTFRSVTVDGVRLGEDFTPTNFNDFPTVLFDPARGPL